MEDPVGVESAGGGEFLDLTQSVAKRLRIEILPAESRDDRNRIDEWELEAEPQIWEIEAALLRAVRPTHVLFLCVANSARSQIAEGLARSLAQSRSRISSAGSEPGSVRSQAVAVMREIGIDITRHRSRGIDEVERPVDLVITLCAEEVCPVWLEDSRRLHWALPDPAAVEGPEDAKLEAFRAVRAELGRRLSVLFG